MEEWPSCDGSSARFVLVTGGMVCRLLIDSGESDSLGNEEVAAAAISTIGATRPLLVRVCVVRRKKKTAAMPITIRATRDRQTISHMVFNSSN
jgi:hypothetical protein